MTAQMVPMMKTAKTTRAGDKVDKPDEEPEYEEYEVEAKTHLYGIHYKLYGRNNKILVEMENNIVGRDVTEIIEELKFKLLGIEINGKNDSGRTVHEVAERLEICNAELIAPIHGLTGQALKTFAEYYKDMKQESEGQDSEPDNPAD